MLIERATQLIPCDHHSRLDVFSVELHTTVRFANKCRHVCSGWHRWLWLVVADDVARCGGGRCWLWRVTLLVVAVDVAGCHQQTDIVSLIASSLLHCDAK